MQRNDDDAKRDPFYLTSERWCDWAIIDPKVSNKITDHLESLNRRHGKKGEGDILRVPFDCDKPEMVGYSRKYIIRQGIFKRFFFGFAGGLALIAPMLLIILHNDRTTALSATCVAILLFAFAMAFYHESDASPFALVGATAAYGAVLVVLVGTAL